MSIDWITVVAQLANFVVLVGLLKRFLYRPIIDGIDAREQEIAERMSAATRIGEAAERAKAEHEPNSSESVAVASAAGRRAYTRRGRSRRTVGDTRSQAEREREEQEKRNAAEAIRYAADFTAKVLRCYLR